MSPTFYVLDNNTSLFMTQSNSPFSGISMDSGFNEGSVPSLESFSPSEKYSLNYYLFK